MKSVWLQGFEKEEDREAFRQILKNSTQLRTRFLQILSEKFDMIERRGFREEDYADTSWTTLQAFRNGKLATLREIADLFDFSDKKET